MSEDNEYILEPGPYPTAIVLDIEVGDPGAECATPEIATVLYEGVWHVILKALMITDGTDVSLSVNRDGAVTIYEGTFLYKKARITLDDPLRAGDIVHAFIDTENCKSQSCTVRVSQLEDTQALCDLDPYTQASGMPTGDMVCVGKDLVMLVHDGEGGVYPGYVIQESCKVCGGINPNCNEDPEIPRYWNVVKCANGNSYQTTTEITIPGQRVTHPTHGNMRWDGTSIDTLNPPNNIGEVTPVSGKTGCPSSGGGGGGSTTYYNIVSCANGNVYQTPTVLSFPNQRVSHGSMGEFYWNGTTTTVESNNVGTVTPLGSTMCSGSTGGGKVYYNIVSCAGGGVYQTETVLTHQNQRVSTGLGEHYWDGTTTNTATHPRNSVIMTHPDGSLIYGCS